MVRKSIVTGVVLLLVLALAPMAAASDTGPASGVAPLSTAGPVLVARVSWEGRQDGTAEYMLPLRITLKHGDEEIDLPPTVTDEKGFATIPVDGLASDVYAYVAKGPQHLTRAGEVALKGEPVTELAIGLMLAGDLNDDNLVNVQDFRILAATFGLAEGDQGYDARADLNGDHVVGVADFALLRGNFGMTGE